ncbi:MerR family transcriptional regulator [Candidatus Methylospira mobilis]|uniref:MerR family transcriptional regulator n=1 Tax=Candidatus Methylospira mobilis TaxID=1808979 RepID=A0A5Q0BMI4_9GAMM|nr:chaperone modulator CbpM [Candidatus Methylospira mobilis]QFY43434.1 MerR family transcriptional regulator [Candidatus Methylospira mobilis]WNV03327.1 chaperone modulator CbpM [Candidatus Methylospira mobilis]
MHTMQIQIEEALLLHEHHELTLAEMAELTGVAEQDLHEWVLEGLLTPRNPDAGDWVFGADRLTTVRTAYRLRNELDLDNHALALTVSLLERIRTLESEVRILRAQIPAL